MDQLLFTLSTKKRVEKILRQMSNEEFWALTERAIFATNFTIQLGFQPIDKQKTMDYFKCNVSSIQFISFSRKEFCSNIE